MKKTKKELEQRIKELERLVEIQDQYIEILRAGYPQFPTYDYNTPNVPVYPNFPITCEHDWIYDYNSTAPHRKCTKCSAYENVNISPIHPSTSAGWSIDGVGIGYNVEGIAGSYSIAVSDPLKTTIEINTLSNVNMNNKYTIKVGSPLIRPGIIVETTVSEKYLVKGFEMVMDKVREFNTADGGGTK